MPSRSSKYRFPIRVGYWTGENERREQEWLGKAWQTVKQRFPADPSNELDKAKLGLRAIALALIYQDFCELAWGLGGEPGFDCLVWAKSLGINESILVKLVNEESISLCLPELEEEPDLFSETLLTLANARREEIFDLLCPDQYDHGEFLRGLVRISRIEEDAYLSDEFVEISQWCSEKCYQIL